MLVSLDLVFAGDNAGLGRDVNQATGDVQFDPETGPSVPWAGRLVYEPTRMNRAPTGGYPCGKIGALS
jgi:hypothetical protein